MDTSDLAISQYSLLGQTPPRSAPGSPVTPARDSSSAAPSEEPAPVVGDTAGLCPQGDPQLNDDAISDPGTTENSEQSTVLLPPVIVVTQQFDESSTKEPCSFEETQEKVQLGTDALSTTAESSVTATPDSDAGQEVGTPDAPAITGIPDSPDLSASPLSSPPSTDVPAECAQSDQSATPENPATPDLSTSEQVTENQTSVQHPCPTSSHPPCADSPMKISLGLLSEAIDCSSAAPSVMQAMAQNTTDKAVYLTGEMKDNWEMERVKEERQKEIHERVEEEGEEEEREGERGEGKMGSAAQPRGEPVDEGCLSSESPAGSATILTTSRRESEEEGDDEGKGSEPETEKRQEDDEEAEERGEHAGKEGKKEKEEQELLQSPRPIESQADCAAELPLDSVAAIRELVTEVSEVETVIGPPPTSSLTP